MFKVTQIYGIINMVCTLLLRRKKKKQLSKIGKIKYKKSEV